MIAFLLRIVLTVFMSLCLMPSLKANEPTGGPEKAAFDYYLGLIKARELSPADRLQHWTIAAITASAFWPGLSGKHRYAMLMATRARQNYMSLAAMDKIGSRFAINVEIQRYGDASSAAVCLTIQSSLRQTSIDMLRYARNIAEVSVAAAKSNAGADGLSLTELNAIPFPISEQTSVLVQDVFLGGLPVAKEGLVGRRPAELLAIADQVSTLANELAPASGECVLRTVQFRAEKENIVFWALEEGSRWRVVFIDSDTLLAGTVVDRFILGKPNDPLSVFEGIMKGVPEGFR